LRYAYGDTLLGPWKSGGVLVDSRSVELNEDGTELDVYYAPHNTHGSIEYINDQWYAFYHRPPRGFGYARQPMVAPVHVEWDEASVADGGKVVITGWDPYLENNIWTAKAGGHEYAGAEVTSEGFNVYGLDPYRYYSAGIACFLNNHGLQADAWDIWDDHMPITGAGNGDIVGYKYFGFGGLAEHKKGLHPFEETKVGNQTQFNLWLTPQTTESFKINVMLDGPWTNDAWQGKKIGEVAVNGARVDELKHFSIDVSEAVDHLDGKHAIYLVVEGPADQMCDVIGLGFSKDGLTIEKPAVPSVRIEVNGVRIALPTIPVRSTNGNGICGYDVYETTVTLPLGTTKLPEINAFAMSNDVEINVTVPEKLYQKVLVACTYKGVTKNYYIHFEEPLKEAIDTIEWLLWDARDTFEGDSVAKEELLTILEEVKEKLGEARTLVEKI